MSIIGKSQHIPPVPMSGAGTVPSGTCFIREHKTHLITTLRQPQVPSANLEILFENMRSAGHSSPFHPKFRQIRVTTQSLYLDVHGLRGGCVLPGAPRGVLTCFDPS